MISDAAFIEMARRGNKYCSSCGLPKIPASDGWKVQCSECHAAAKPIVFCKCCGSPIDRARIDYAKKKGGQCTKCWRCSKMKPEPHPVHDAVLPDRF